MEIEDAVHGVIELPEDIAHIIKTPQFQRLKSIKQLGVFFFFYSKASHTRYEHCIGTYWLAKKMLNALETNSSWIAEDKEWPMYRLAVEIAGLLHDIGHGPFSHMWETVSKNYHHEWNALPCIDAIFQQLDNSICSVLRRNNNFGIELIKALVVCEPNLLPTPMPDRYSFIFEIINNKQCKLDVDKWDYIKRDQHYLCELCNPDTNFVDVFLKAVVADNGKHLQYRYEDYDKIYKLFAARWELHDKAYRSSKNLACDYLMRQGLTRSQHKIDGKNFMEINANDIGAFLKLTDDVILDFVKNTIEYYYLLNHKQITSVDTSLSHDIAIERVIPGPTEEMPLDGCFHFYGDAKKKPIIKRNNQSIREIMYFKLENVKHYV